MNNKIRTLNDFIKKVISFSEQKNDGYEIFYRGESKDYGEKRCLPGIFRTEKLIKNEDKIFKEFITLNPEEFLNDKLTIEKLTRMQHYRLPTRLLDLSTNALLGLYFAIESLILSKERNLTFLHNIVIILTNLILLKKYNFCFIILKMRNHISKRQ